MEIPYGYCHCGCGQKTKIAKQTDTNLDHKAGEHQKYIYQRDKAIHNADPIKVAQSTQRILALIDTRYEL